MGALRALVVDDERAARAYLGELLMGTGRVEVVGSVEDVETARKLLAEGLAVDVVFVDINLGGRADDASGLRWAETLGGARGGPAIVLATAHPEHALAGFELGVADYLIKPWSASRVGRCVERLLARGLPSSVDAPTRVAARRGRALRLIDVEDVLAFEAEERLTFVHTATERLDVDLSLAVLESSFGAHFLRVHRQWLVAVARVVGLSQDELGAQVLLHRPGAEPLAVPVTRERVREIRQRLLEKTVGLRR